MHSRRDSHSKISSHNGASPPLCVARSFPLFFDFFLPLTCSSSSSTSTSTSSSTSCVFSPAGRRDTTRRNDVASLRWSPRAREVVSVLLDKFPHKQEADSPLFDRVFIMFLPSSRRSAIMPLGGTSASLPSRNKNVETRLEPSPPSPPRPTPSFSSQRMIMYIFPRMYSRDYTFIYISYAQFAFVSRCKRDCTFATIPCSRRHLIALIRQCSVFATTRRNDRHKL